MIAIGNPTSLPRMVHLRAAPAAPLIAVMHQRFSWVRQAQESARNTACRRHSDKRTERGFLFHATILVEPNIASAEGMAEHERYLPYQILCLLCRLIVP
jgi:hypothetical protein